ncbi:MAG: FtsX-like permease family protein [Anaerolineales bacterium]
MPKLSPRWAKIWADLRVNKTRTILVVLSIVVGIFAIGSISGTAAILSREVKVIWQDINPASALLVTNGFSQEQAEQIRDLPEVDAVQVWRTLDAETTTGTDDPVDVRLFAVPNYGEMNLNIIEDDATGDQMPQPEPGTVWLERTAYELLDVSEGDEITMNVPGGESRTFTIGGTAYDITQPSATIENVAYGFIQLDTMYELSERDNFTILAFRTAENRGDEEYVTEIANNARDILEREGSIVFNVQVLDPNEPSAFIFVEALLQVLGVIGSLTFLLSGFLIINIMSALLTQQTKQIGVMKAVGAKTSQIISMYLGMAGAYGLLALFIGLPLSFLGARGLSTFVGGLSNYKIEDFSAPWWVFAVQIFIGLVVPLLAALIPVVLNTRISVREALDQRGINAENNTVFDRIITRFRGLPRPVLLSFRNTFRQKVRLGLTLVTLTLAGAIFATVFSVRNSLFNTLDDALAYDDYDVSLNMDAAYDRDEMVQIAQDTEGVARVEAWTTATSRTTIDGESSDDITLTGIPADTEMVNPIIEAGDWVSAQNLPENPLVINGNMAEDLGFEVGDEVTLILRGQETTWNVVGVARAVFSFDFTAWTPYPVLAEAINEPGAARWLRVNMADPGDEDAQQAMIQRLSENLSGTDIVVEESETRIARENSFNSRFSTLVGSLLVLAVLLAIVGGLGITGTTSINVIERMREIGVMRSIGAVDYQVLGIFILEALIVGAIGWVLGSILSWPISRLLSDGVGLAFSNAPLAYEFSFLGIILWLVLASVLAFVSSWLPARRASRLTLREVLAYEG